MHHSNRNPLSLSDCEDIAIRLLAYMAAEPDHLSRFLALTGMGPEDIRANAGSREFQVAMLDHLMTDETLLLSFCANENIEPELISPARHKLSGESYPTDGF